MGWPLRRYFRLLWWTLCLLTFIALPLTIWEFQRQHYDVNSQAWFIGGIFVILSMPISIYEIAMHTEYYTQPRLQKHVIRILLMVPIYAVDAWFALRFQKAREYLDPIRECYEAFVIYSFFAYLMAFLQDTYGDLDEHMSKKPQMQHMWGLRLVLRPWDMGTRFLWECKKGVLNYVILRPICTALAFITDVFQKYGEGQINFEQSYVYLAAVTNFSQLWALYCLVMLYTAMHTELAPIRPLSKFLCIKAVVFVTFWQGIAIAILVYADVIRPWYKGQDVASSIQDFLICIEMFLAALAHAYAFPPRDYMAGHSKGFFANVRYIFDLRDVVDDVGLVVEEHVSTATTAVVKVPQRAVKKAAQGLAKNTKKLFAAAGTGNKGSSSGRFMDEEEESASRCALLGPISPQAAAGASVGQGSRHSGGGGGGGGGAPTSGAWRGSGGGGGGGGIVLERELSSGGSTDGSSGGGGTEALLGPYGTGGSSLGPLAPPQHHHLMRNNLEPAAGLGTGGEGAAGASVALPTTATTTTTSQRGIYQHYLPQLPPSTAALSGPGGAGGGSAFNTLVTSALYHTRGGYDYGGGGGGGGGRGLASRVTRRNSGNNNNNNNNAERQSLGEATPYCELSDYAAGVDGGGGTAGGPPSSSSGLELPLIATSHASSSSGSGRQQGQQGQQGQLSDGSRRGAIGGVGGVGSKKTTDVLMRSSRVGGGGGGGGGDGGPAAAGAGTGPLSGGAPSNDDAPYERLPNMTAKKA